MDAMLCCQLDKDEAFVDLEQGTSIDNFENVEQTNTKCTYTSILDSTNETTSFLVDNEFYANTDSKESYVNNLIDNVDLSELGLSMGSCDMHVPFDDCLCFETCSVQKEDLLDPLLELHGASFSLSNNDSVQLDNEKDNFNTLNTNYNSNNNSNNNNDEAFSLQRFLVSKEASMPYPGTDNVVLDSSDNYNFYHVFELIGKTNNNNQNQECGVSQQSSEPKTVQASPKAHAKKKSNACPIAKGRSYLPIFKQKVLEYAANHTFRETAVKFNINCNTVTEWSQASKRLLLMQNRSTTIMPGSVCNLKTDLPYTPVSKTEHIVITDDVIIETDMVMESLAELPAATMRPDLRFVHWVRNKRNKRQELTRDVVFKTATICLNQAPPSLSEPAPDWFPAYIARFDKVLKGPGAASPHHETEKYIMYPHNFKTEVALYALVFTKNAAARVFNVPRKGVFDWCNQISTTSELKESCNVAVTTRNYSEQMVVNKLDIYNKLHEWCELQQTAGTSPTSTEIKEKARQMFCEQGIPHCKFSEGWLNKFCKRSNIKLKFVGDAELLMWVLTHFDKNIQLSHQQITDMSCQVIGTKTFKGSKGWTLRFLKRHSNLLQHVPTTADQLPGVAEPQIQRFRQYLHQVIDTTMLDSASVGALDEIPISFNYTTNEKAKLPLLRSCGFKNCQAVVLLCVMANGQVLPPAVVLKEGSANLLKETPTPDMVVLYSSNGTVDEAVLGRWVDLVWLRHVTQPSVLLLDAFEPHQSPGLQQRLSNSTTVCVIPDGCSTQLLPHTVNVTRMFQQSIKEQWSEIGRNPSKYHYPDHEHILSGVRTAYLTLQQHPNSIIDSFKLTGIFK